MKICIIVILIIYMMVLISKYEPSIDIIVQGKRYRVLLWYNSHKSNYSNKPTVVRNYIQLFII
nr:MAG TPA: hypothetical protein [Crassvirales sp.]